MTTHNEDHIIVIRTYNDLGKATSAKERMDEAGIKAIMDDMDVMGLTPTAGIDIKIFAADAEKADEILKELD